MRHRPPARFFLRAESQRASRTQSGAAFDGIGYTPGTTLPFSMTGVPGSGTSIDTFTYNNRGEVIGSSNLNSATGTPNPELFRSYDYDPIGNRRGATENTTTKSYVSNNLNQYLSVTSESSVAQPVYDADGNMTADGEGKAYTWDCENRLIQVTLPNSDIVRYSYDGNSRRVRREHITSTNTETTTYLYDDWNVIVEWHSLNFESRTLKSYIWGLDLSNTLQGSGGVGGLLASIAHNPSTPEDLKTYSFTYDGNGNVSELFNGTGTIASHYTYDIFGKEMEIVGIYAEQNLYRFSTKPWDAQVEFSYYGYRFYQPQNGRWINRDPVEEDGGMNIYSMSENSLIDLFDVLGLRYNLIIVDDPSTATNQRLIAVHAADMLNMKFVLSKQPSNPDALWESQSTLEFVSIDNPSAKGALDAFLKKTEEDLLKKAKGLCKGCPDDKRIKLSIIYHGADDGTTTLGTGSIYFKMKDVDARLKALFNKISKNKDAKCIDFEVQHCFDEKSKLTELNLTPANYTYTTRKFMGKIQYFFRVTPGTAVFTKVDQ